MDAAVTSRGGSSIDGRIMLQLVKENHLRLTAM